MFADTDNAIRGWEVGGGRGEGCTGRGRGRGKGRRGAVEGMKGRVKGNDRHCWKF